MTKLSDTAGASVSTEYENLPIIRAGELVGLPIIIWGRRKANTAYGDAMFCDFQHAGDAQQELATVVFSSNSPAYKQLDAVETDTITKEGLEVVILEAGRSFKLGDPDDLQMVSHPENRGAEHAPASAAQPQQSRKAPPATQRPVNPTQRRSSAPSDEGVPW